MKKLVVYYSLGGNTRFISELIAQACGADIMELKPKEDELKFKGFKKYFWGGRQIFTNHKPELESFDKNPRDYDTIFIGTPVWAFRHVPAVESFLSETKLTDKRIALFCCHRGMKGRTLAKMKVKLGGNEIVGEIDFKEPLRYKKDAAAGRVKIWVQEILNKV